MSGAIVSENTQARPDQIRALDRLRRSQRVTLVRLAQQYPRGTSWLSEALAGYIPLSRGQVRDLRKLIQELSGDGK